MFEPHSSSVRLSASPSSDLRGITVVPGDKSVSHRALIIGGLAHGETLIKGLLESEDVLRTAEALRDFGVQVLRHGKGQWSVIGQPWCSPESPIDCGNSGTTARLMLGAMAGFPIQAEFTGDASLRTRPMDRVFQPLRRMGLLSNPPKPMHLPVQVKGRQLFGIRHLNRHASAQVKSAILLAGLQSLDDLEVVEPYPTRDHSERMLKWFGCDIRTRQYAGETVISLGDKRSLRGTQVQVSGDPSSAAFPLVAALLTPGSDVTIENVMVNPFRTGLFKTLLEMGADLKIYPRGFLGGEPIACIRARYSSLKAARVPAARAPAMIDEYPLLSVAAAFASGMSVFKGLGELRFKESDRLSAILDGLNACKVRCEIIGDDLLIDGTGERVTGGCRIDSRGDHRIAMAFLTLGLAAKAPVEVSGAEMIATSFPDFVPLMRVLGADIAAP
ncbi:MAG TPA: 3-phosphoshikimate 1-carboxyvinyltransferase [Sphingomicrobium sp.]|nr:3-phosphoshikimate 1-carboxyvinyltransferase [Sphingomicrobium sp.]